METSSGQGKQSATVVSMDTTTEQPKPTKTSLYLPPKANHKLKEIALSKGCKVHDLLIAGVDHVLTSEGFKPVSEYSEK
ncbi:hypothetical protein AKJ29_00010 [Aliiroseovarius crassostreae]|uniref:Uncharacterized protein n=2 Tax=Aliiroseovarius crassostreae TaxID=154981 RepID=A0A0P7KI31_9RHOB|nr:hypothetical protein AKJ29_00010 [Aliiroseovarius crassostreae]